MKKLLIHYTQWALLVLCTACDFDLDLFSGQPQELPPITTTGERTFGCLVNGELFLPRGSSSGAIYQKGFLSVGADLDDSNRSISLFVFEAIDDLKLGKEYSLIDTSKSSATYLCRDSILCDYEAQNTFDGWLKISFIDKENLIVSGTFEFSTALNGCDTIRVTDGRFDLIYIP